MLTGATLGAAIRAAMDKKGVSQQQVADHFGVRQSSVSEWCKYGRVAKVRLPALFDYFSDVVPIEFWGLYPSGRTTALTAQEQSTDEVYRLHALLDSLRGNEALLAEAAGFLNYLATRVQSGESGTATGTHNP